MTESAALALVFVAVGVVFIAFGVPLARERVPPNDWYGCRTRATLSDERVWYAVNRATGRDMITGGALVIICALAALAFARRVNSDAVCVVLLAVTLFAVARMATRGMRQPRQH